MPWDWPGLFSTQSPEAGAGAAGTSYVCPTAAVSTRTTPRTPIGKDFVLPQTEKELGASVWPGLGGGWGRYDIQGPEGGQKPRAGSAPGTPGDGVRETLFGM